MTIAREDAGSMFIKPDLLYVFGGTNTVNQPEIIDFCDYSQPVSDFMQIKIAN